MIKKFPFLNNKYVRIILALCFLAVVFALTLIVRSNSYAATNVVVRSPYKNYRYNYKGNLHDHSTNSDGSLAPGAVANKYAGFGYGFYTQADHNKVTGGSNVGTMVNLGGAEELSLNSDTTHVLLSVISGGYSKNLSSVSSAISSGAITVLNHFATDGKNNPKGDEGVLTLPGVTGLEVFNGKRIDESGREVAEWDKLLQAGYRIFGFAADDAHTASQFGTVGIVVNSSKPAPDKADIIANIKAGNFYAARATSIGSFHDLTVLMDGHTIVAKTKTGSAIRWIVNGSAGATVAGSTSSYVPEYNASVKVNYVRIEVLDSSGATVVFSQPIYITIGQNLPPMPPDYVQPTPNVRIPQNPDNGSNDNPGDATNAITKLIVGDPVDFDTSTPYYDSSEIQLSEPYSEQTESKLDSTVATPATSSGDTEAPTVPTDIIAGYNEGKNTVDVSWGASTDNKAVTGYEIQRQKMGETTWELLSESTENLYSDFGVSSNATYNYQIRSFDAAKNFSVWSLSSEVVAGTFVANVTPEKESTVMDKSNKVEIIAPEGAVAENLFVLIEPNKVSKPSLPNKLLAVGPYYEFKAKNISGEEITKFEKAIEVKFDYSKIKLSGYKKESIKIVSSTDGGATFEEMPTNLDGTYATTATDHFSIYALTAQKSFWGLYLWPLFWLFMLTVGIVGGYIGWKKYQQDEGLEEHAEDYIYKH